MKQIIIKLLIMLLKRLNVSLMLNFEIKNGDISGLCTNIFYYNNIFENSHFRYKSGEYFILPEGNFSIKK